MPDLAVEDDALPVILACYKVHRGRPAKDPRDRKFLLWLRPDPASRFPIVAQEQNFMDLSLLFWCTHCRKDISFLDAQVCEQCDASFCGWCSQADHHRSGHPADHKTKTVRTNY